MVYLYVRVVLIAGEDGGLDWRYSFFFIEQIATIATFLKIRSKISKRILDQPIDASTELLKKYRVFRTTFYVVEICLMFWV